MSLIIEEKIRSVYSKVMITESLYSLSLYLFINKNKESDTLFLLGDVINREVIKNKLSNYIIYDTISALPKNKVEFILLSNGFYIGRYKKLYNYFNSLGDNCFFGHDHISISPVFYSKKMIIIEDGLSNYKLPKKISKLKLKAKQLCRTPIFVKGYDPTTKFVYLTTLSKIPEELLEKTITIDRKLFIESLSEILEGVFYKKLILDCKYSLIITQPFSEDGYITEEDKIKIYKEMVNTKLKTIIKPHPRELTDYKKYFPEAIVIENEVLAESLLENKCIVEIKTIFSSSIYNYPYSRNVKIYIKGSSFNDSLSHEFGYIDEKLVIYNNIER